MIEIERKFLIKNQDFRTEAVESSRIMQGYLRTSPGPNVRVRSYGDKGFLTIKGPTSESGTTRFEWETEIPADEAQALFQLCEPGRIEKIRYLVPAGDHVYEVDEFLGVNQGLFVAEIELTAEDEDFIKPAWLGAEVTGDARYYNGQLAKVPYNTWPLQSV